MVVTRPYLVKQIAAKLGQPEKVEALLKSSSAHLGGLPMPEWSLNMKQYLLNRYGA